MSTLIMPTECFDARQQIKLLPPFAYFGKDSINADDFCTSPGFPTDFSFDLDDLSFGVPLLSKKEEELAFNCKETELTGCLTADKISEASQSGPIFMSTSQPGTTSDLTSAVYGINNNVASPDFHSYDTVVSSTSNDVRETKMTATAVSNYLGYSRDWNAERASQASTNSTRSTDQPRSEVSSDHFDRSPSAVSKPTRQILQIDQMQHVARGGRSPSRVGAGPLEVSSRRQSAASIVGHDSLVAGTGHLLTEANQQYGGTIEQALLSPQGKKTSSTLVPTTAYLSVPSTPHTCVSPAYSNHSEDIQPESYSKRQASPYHTNGFYGQEEYKFNPESISAPAELEQQFAMEQQLSFQPTNQPTSDNQSRRQFRHHSYSDGRRTSNVTPPSPSSSDDFYSSVQQARSRDFYGDSLTASGPQQMNRLSRRSGEDAYSAFPGSPTETKPYVSHSDLSGSANLLKKSLSVGVTKTSMMPQFGQVTSGSFLSPSASMPTLLPSKAQASVVPPVAQKPRGFDHRGSDETKAHFTAMLNSPLVSVTTCSLDNDLAHSPGRGVQLSPTDLSIARSQIDFGGFPQHQTGFENGIRLSRQLDDQQSSGSVDGNLAELFGQYRQERDHFAPHVQQMSPNAFANPLHNGLIKQQEAERVYSSTLPYNGHYLAIPTTHGNPFHPLRSHYTNSQRHHPYQGPQEQMTARSSMAPATRPSSEGLCAVCGDNAACQHYGVRTCEGCKGFFKRTVQKKSTYVCLANKNCPVDKRRRNRCQFCRYEKCLAVGMVKEVVRTDHLKGRRGRLPSKPKGPKDPVAPPSPPISFITSLVRAHVDTNPAATNTDNSKYRPPGVPAISPPLTTSEETHSFFELLSSCLSVVRQWAEKIPGFGSLSEEDQTNLIESSFLEIFLLRLVYRSEIQENKLVFCNGIALHRDQLYRSFGEWVDSIMTLACFVTDLNIDISSFSCLLGLLLFQERPGVRDIKKVEEFQTMVIDSLKEHVTKSSVTADRPHFFNKLLGVLPELKAIARIGVNRIYTHKLESPSIPMPACLQRSLDNA